jgi:anti-sigma regulatory factor (Ser/Thr protein kinase)
VHGIPAGWVYLAGHDYTMPAVPRHRCRTVHPQRRGGRRAHRGQDPRGVRPLAFAETRICDVVLAVNEALANAAEFAYRRGPAGTVGITAIRGDGCGTLTVTITDQGLWREVDPLRRRRSRGRGIPLMRALADDVVIDTTAPGTRVCLRFLDHESSEEPGTPLLA